ncbi:xylose repressor [Streptomyces spiroverticillatus]|uniref:Xylose repressor n=1 Tax=Streptomyces finlayi TaxID=67296 RepID=A0A918WY90_9ACTN|nr:ROK family transcriptional regulator [Streptomyces finlayi]GHA11174.1 xylose repressor [Streptomyces spiroverticillatus]GHC95136.1 xylose repressor [Streptomyces finlayi]
MSNTAPTPAPSAPAPGARPTDSASVRRHNLALVLRHIAAHGPCPRTRIAEGTGLVPASVTGLVADLAARGLVREDGAAGAPPAPASDAVRTGGAGPGTRGRGRPSRPVLLVPERVLAISVQITLERLRVRLTDLAGTVVTRAETTHRVPQGDPGALARAVATAVRGAEADARSVPGALLSRVVVAMVGPVTSDSSHTVMAATDFGWTGPADLGALISAELPGLDCPLEVVNDANAAALAEYQALAARRPQPPHGVAYLKADTGVGGGLVVGGRIHDGSHGVAIEPGHVPLALDGPPCACGARGCLAVYAGPEPLLHAAGLGDALRTHGKDAALAALDRALHDGDPAAVRALGAAGEAVGAAVLGMIVLLDVEEIVLGGYFADWYRWLAPAVDARLAGRRALAPPLVPPITPGVLGEEATLRGAAALAREAVLDDPGAVPVL